MSLPLLVVLTGAGISAESGLKTFRDSDGLWEGNRIEDVATPGAWRRDPERVLRFYNERRSALAAAEPNAGHRALADLEKTFQVTVITQNVDDLHERAGSSKVLHLHGELLMARSTIDPSYVVHWGARDITTSDLCPKGGQLRPHIVWFGESVPLMEEAQEWARQADAFAVIGTSLAVYPAAGLVDEVRPDVPLWVVDPKRPPVSRFGPIHFIIEKASVGVERMAEELAVAFSDSGGDASRS